MIKRVIIILFILFGIAFSQIPTYKELLKNYNCVLEKYLNSINKYICVVFNDKSYFNIVEEVDYLKNHTIEITEGDKFFCLDKCIINYELLLYNPINNNFTILKKGYLKINVFEEKHFEIKVKIDELRYVPGKYIILLKEKICSDNLCNTIEKRGSIVNIRKYKILDIKKEEKLNFLERIITINVNNLGNTVICKNLTLQLPLIDVYLVKYVNTIYSVNLNKLIIPICLKPKETKTIIISINYTPLYFLPLLIILILFIYLVYNSRIIIKRDYSFYTDKGKKYLKVKIEIINNKEYMKFVSIIEPIDGKLINAFPSNYILVNNTKIVWDINELKVGEPLVLEYILEINKLKVKIGGLTIKYIDADGNTKIIKEKEKIVKLV